MRRRTWFGRSTVDGRAASAARATTQRRLTDVKVVVTVTREYEMDEARILDRWDFDPPPHDAPNAEKREWLIESFWELCGFERDQDHLDGTYVHLDAESSDTDYEW